ncbi:MAG: hypothetical protein LBJ59_05980 [Zoogloeaceae bacterium]|jgi:hypothetical protein|nr:hypothetical protein [Zoogloeaceae bacterium]
MQRLSCRALLVFLLLLSGCANDGAAYLIDGQRHAVSIVRDNLFWEKQVNLALVITRLPDCQRRHAIQKANPKAHIELWQPGQGTYILKIGQNMYVTETRTCEGFARLDEEPPGGLGAQLGVFGEIKGVFSFVPTQKEES